MIEPIEIVEEENGEVSIGWSDGSSSRFTAAQLRRACPCAGCVNEWTGEKMLDPAKIPDDLTFRNIGIVGRYALNFNFSDGHETGIFSFKYLKELKV